MTAFLAWNNDVEYYLTCTMDNITDGDEAEMVFEMIGDLNRACEQASITGVNAARHGYHSNGHRAMGR